MPRRDSHVRASKERPPWIFRRLWLLLSTHQQLLVPLSRLDTFQDSIKLCEMGPRAVVSNSITNSFQFCCVAVDLKLMRVAGEASVPTAEEQREQPVWWGVVSNRSSFCPACLFSSPEANDARGAGGCEEDARALWGCGTRRPLQGLIISCFAKRLQAHLVCRGSGLK